MEELQPDAEMSIRRELVVEAVAEAEGFAVTDEDVEAQIRGDAEASGQEADRLLAEVRRQRAFETIRADMLRARTVTFLVDSRRADIHRAGAGQGKVVDSGEQGACRERRRS